MRVARLGICLSGLLSVAACAAAQPAPAAAEALNERSPVEKACKLAAPRVPALFAQFDWVKQAPRNEHIYSGNVSGASPEGAAFDDPNAAASQYLVLREIDLDADGDCDLVGTVTSGTGAAGSGRSHLIFWFADPKGWRRQGPAPGPGAKGINAVGLELFEPAGAAEMAVFGADGYAPTRDGGRVALVVRPPQQSVTATDLRVLEYDTKSRSMQPRVSVDVAAKALALCGKASDSEVCATW